MEENIFSYGASDGQKLFYRSWNGASLLPPLIFIHGIESHSGWYIEPAEKLAGNGLRVYGLDRRGSGLNFEGRGDLNHFQRLIQDLNDFFLHKEIERCVLVGLCWGAKVALYFSLCHPEKVSSIIFVTPGFKTKLHISISKKIKWLTAMVFAPGYTLALPIEPEMFTRDQFYLQRIKEDNYRLKTITSRFFKENLRLEKAIRKLKLKSDTPALLFLAEEDDIVDNNAVMKFLQGYFKNLEIISYPACSHGLFFEPKRDEVIKDITRWVLKDSDRLKGLKSGV